MFFHRLMQRSGSFFRKLFLSYLLILLFLCGIMLFLSQQLIRSISVYAESEAKQSVASYRSAIEGVLTSLSTLSQELTTDASLRACIACEGDFPVEIRYGLPQVIDKFGSYKFLNEYLDMIFLYLPAPNYVITDSSAYSPETWCRSFGLDMSFFDDLLRHHAGTMFPLHFSGTMGDKTIVLYSIDSVVSREPSAVLGFVVDPTLSSARAGLSSLLTAYDSDGNALFYSAPEAKDIPFSFVAGEGMTTAENMVFYALPDAKFPLTFVSSTPISEFAPILSTSKTVTIVCFVLLAIGGAILSYSLAVHNYRPLQHLAKKAAGNDTPSSPPMEYLERSIAELVKMRTITAEADRNHHTLYCDNLFNKLLYGEILSESLMQEYAQKYNLSLPDGRVQLVCIHSNQPGIRESIRKFIAGHAQAPDAYYAIDGVHGLKLLFFGESGLALCDYFCGSYPQVCTSGEFRIAVSAPHRNLIQLSVAYDETQKVLDHMRFLGLTGLFSYFDLQKISQDDRADRMFEIWFNKFYNFLVEQNMDAASSVQQQIFNELKNGHYPLQFIKCKVFSFIDHTISAISVMSSKSSEIWEQNAFSDRLLSCSSIDQLENTYYSIFEQLSQFVWDSSTQETVSERIQQITQQNFKDPMFGVSYVADQLGVSSAYVSKVFKKATGGTLLDHVQGLRIAFAKELMRTTDDTLSSIALQSGFTNDVSFIRVFKKFEGVTPGKYRSMISSQKEGSLD